MLEERIVLAVVIEQGHHIICPGFKKRGKMSRHTHLQLLLYYPHNCEQEMGVDASFKTPM